MVILKVKDQNGNYLECFQNNDGLFFIEIGNGDDNYSNYVTLDIDDARRLATELNIYIVNAYDGKETN